MDIRENGASPANAVARFDLEWRLVNASLRADGVTVQFKDSNGLLYATPYEWCERDGFPELARKPRLSGAAKKRRMRPANGILVPKSSAVQ